MAQRGARLSLDEAASFSPPPTFVAAGAYVSENGASITWSRGDRRIVLADSAGATKVMSSPSLVSPVGASFGRTREQIEVVDGRDSLRLVQLSVGGELIHVTRLDARMRASQAVRTAQGDWYLLGTDSTSELVIAFAAAPHFTVRVLELPQEVTSLGLGDGWRIAADGEAALIVGPVVAGCAVRAFGREARTMLALGATAATCAGERTHSSEVRSRGLVHLSTLPLDFGRYLQTLADPRTDERGLRIISRTGLVERTATIGAPIALLSSSVAGWLVGIREPRNTEVVLYRWSWQLR